jgi:hypothetical protein
VAIVKISTVKTQLPQVIRVQGKVYKV